VPMPRSRAGLNLANRAGKELVIDPHLAERPRQGSGPGTDSPSVPKGSDSPVNTAIQTPSTGQGFAFQMSQGQAQGMASVHGHAQGTAHGSMRAPMHTRSQTDPDGLRKRGEARWLRGELQSHAEGPGSEGKAGGGEAGVEDTPIGIEAAAATAVAMGLESPLAVMKHRPAAKSSRPSHASHVSHGGSAPGRARPGMAGTMSTPGSTITSPVDMTYPLPAPTHTPIQPPQGQDDGGTHGHMHAHTHTQQPAGMYTPTHPHPHPHAHAYAQGYPHASPYPPPSPFAYSPYQYQHPHGHAMGMYDPTGTPVAMGHHGTGHGHGHGGGGGSVDMGAGPFTPQAQSQLHAHGQHGRVQGRGAAAQQGTPQTPLAAHGQGQGQGHAQNQSQEQQGGSGSGDMGVWYSQTAQ
jgi:hypothetical protein